MSRFYHIHTWSHPENLRKVAMSAATNVLTCDDVYSGWGFDPLVFDASHGGYFHFDKFLEGLAKGFTNSELFLWCETVLQSV